MAIIYKGEKLTGTIRREGAYAGGNQHFVLNGTMLCPSGLNFHANDLIIKAYKPTLNNCKNVISYISCKKCAKKLNELIKKTETKQQEAK